MLQQLQKNNPLNYTAHACYKNSKIKTLSNTHNFAECDLKIKSKSEYFGKGKYQYYDIDSNVTSIYMNEINCVSSNTKASGEIKEKNRFKLNKHFEISE